ncbi:hypothetical protein D3C71_1858300 [compost metagenome]
MKSVKCNIRPKTSQHGTDTTSDVDTRHPIALALQRIRAGIAGRQADRPLGGKPSHQNSHVLATHPSPLEK